MAGQVQDLPPARPHRLESGHHQVPGPRLGTRDDLVGELVDREFRPGQRLRDGRDDRLHLVRCHPGVLGEGVASRRHGGQGTGPQGHVRRGQQMDRGPNVLTRVRSVHRAVRTSVRVSPFPRSPTDSSAADSTWACAPSTAATAAPGEAMDDAVAAASGWRCWRAGLRAFAPGQVTVAVAGDRVVMARN